MSDDDKLTIEVKGELAKQLKMLKEELGVEDETEVVRKALALLMLSFGRKVELNSKERRESIIIEDFRDLEPIKE